MEVALQFLLCSSESLNNLLRLGIAHGQVSKEQRQAFLTWKAPLPLPHFLHPGWALDFPFSLNAILIFWPERQLVEVDNIETVIEAPLCPRGH